MYISFYKKVNHLFVCLFCKEQNILLPNIYSLIYILTFYTCFDGNLNQPVPVYMGFGTMSFISN